MNEELTRIQIHTKRKMNLEAKEEEQPYPRRHCRRIQSSARRHFPTEPKEVEELSVFFRVVRLA